MKKKIKEKEEKMRIILASKSPRRKELLELMGVKNFEIIVSQVDETMDDTITLEENSKMLAYHKAKAVFDKTFGDRIVIGSDTLVTKNGKIYGKPKTKEEAFQMIKELKASTHQVITSLCVLKEENGKLEEYVDYDIANVEMKGITDEEIQAWIDTGEAMDKAGAYAIQGKFAIHINKIDGNYNSIMGLPISKLYDVIKENIISQNFT